MDNSTDNEKVLQYINQTRINSLQRYLDLAPKVKPASTKVSPLNLTYPTPLRGSRKQG